MQPPDAEKLDFRGVQGIDRNTAIAMSSGKGDLSRLYKTTDACKTRKLIFTNPDKDGFWDALQIYGSAKRLPSAPVSVKALRFASTAHAALRGLDRHLRSG